jgi:hypothetical protein
MQTRKRISRGSKQEDATGQAGWIYTDLLLGLAVIFLATISFIPQTTAIGSTSSAYVYTERFDQVFQVSYSNPDEALLTSDIASFLTANDLPAESVVLSAQFIGSYDPATEKVSDAISRAVTFSTGIDQQNPGLLANAATTVDANSNLTTGKVLVRLLFGVRVK